ncbi:hypothetical protein AGABI1DRAFT_93293 [Agaricus bisporus var. burnettii JB137-S8]|uniref:Cytochrome P450 n=1 Tax=Agaricus bisporus var. burnettii (strain JB137-S8 / ATCC MYA-4627 / FGSC 10392) TaxID=597362 RepID=K5XRR9_AGABU|nr:uncharacterized protein AGABI1DRAFT_93293 [Agaricus bisporus var. burnettii JB137-S8]EKM77565.1 hypothetical protein AGABI1DRAFT_93293 [Agaricus bisporus var. burnettii JB137-S8]
MPISEVYEWAGSDITAHVNVFPDKAGIFVADVNVSKEIITYRARFLSLFGYSVVASEGEAWKKNRKICAPSFSERNNRLVWEEAVSTMNDIFDNAWENKERVVVDHSLDITLLTIPAGHRMTFKDSLYIVTTHVIPKVLLPGWVISLREETRQIDMGFKELKAIFSSSFLLVTKPQRTRFTTRSPSCSLHPDEQEKLYPDIKSIVKDFRAPTYNDIPLLTRLENAH